MHNLEHPVWKIKQANRKIFLEVTWTKSISRAVSIERPRINHVDKTPRSAQPSSDTVEPLPCVMHVVTGSSGKDKKRKKKSPSTRKRDRARLVNWRTEKRMQKKVRKVLPHPFSLRMKVPHGQVWNVEKHPMLINQLNPMNPKQNLRIPPVYRIPMLVWI